MIHNPENVESPGEANKPTESGYYWWRPWKGEKWQPACVFVYSSRIQARFFHEPEMNGDPYGDWIPMDRPPADRTKLTPEELETEG